GRRAGDGARQLHPVHGQGPLASAPAGARRREHVLRRRRRADRRAVAGAAQLRPVVDRRPVGDRGRRGARRAGRRRRGRRPRAAARRARAAPVPGQPPGGRVPVVHPGLGWLEASPEGRDWLKALPDLRAECERAWGVSSAGAPFAYAYASLAYPVVADGTPAVLKLQFPDRESEHEADALEAWDGDGAVRLLARDDERRALLLERLLPGTPLTGHDDALDVILGLLPRLWVPAPAPVRALADEA